MLRRFQAKTMPTDEEKAIRACIINIVLGSGVYGNSTTVGHLSKLIQEPEREIETHCRALSNVYSWVSFTNVTVSVHNTAKATEFVQETRREIHDL